MIDETISNIKDLRENIETEFCDWLSDVKRIVEAVGSIPRIAGKQIYHANSTTDGATPEGYSNLQPLAEGLLFWKVDMPSPSSLLCEIKLWQKHWIKRSELSDIPEHLSTSFVSCDADVYPNILVL